MKVLSRRGACLFTFALLSSAVACSLPPPPKPTPHVNTLASFTIPMEMPEIPPKLKNVVNWSVQVTCVLRSGDSDLNQNTVIVPWGTTPAVMDVASGPFGPGTSGTPDNYRCAASSVKALTPFEHLVVSGPFAYAGDPSMSLWVHTLITTPTISFSPHPDFGN
jgi:hypothetical protein